MQEGSDFLVLSGSLVSLWSIQIFQGVSSRRRLPTNTGAFIFHLEQAAVNFLRSFDTVNSVGYFEVPLPRQKFLPSVLETATHVGHATISTTMASSSSQSRKAVCYRNSGVRSTPRHLNYHPHRCPQHHYAHRAAYRAPTPTENTSTKQKRYFGIHQLVRNQTPAHRRHYPGCQLSDANSIQGQSPGVEVLGRPAVWVPITRMALTFQHHRPSIGHMNRLL